MEDREIIGILDNLISRGVRESEIIEYKTNLSDPEAIGKYISAMSNSATLLDEKRAFLFWGIRDDNLEVVGTTFDPNHQKVHKSNELLMHWLSNMTGGCDFEFRELNYHGKSVVVLLIPAAKWVETKFKGTAYIRVASVTTTLDSHVDKKRLLWKKLVQEVFEEEIALSAKTKEEVLSMLDYAAYYRLLGQAVPENTEDIMTMLLTERLIVSEMKESPLYHITNLGALLLARNLEDFYGLANKALRVIRYKGKNRLIAEIDFSVETGYAAGFQNLIDRIQLILPREEYFADGVRKIQETYPEIILRELIPNALIHQDFLVKGRQPRIEIFEDRIEITNAGEPLIPIDRFLDMAPISRNESLARMMHKLRICEERGSGIDRVVEAIEQKKMPALEIRSENDAVTVIVYAHKDWEQLTKEEKIRTCYQHCCFLYYTNRVAMTNRMLRDRFSVYDINHANISRVILDAKKAELIKSTVESPKKYVPFWA